MYRNRHVSVQSTAVAKANLSRESKVASNLLERCRYPMSEKKKKKTKKIAVCAVKAYISKSILPTYVRFSRAQSHLIIHVYIIPLKIKCKFGYFITHLFVH